MNITNINDMIGRQYKEQFLTPHKLHRDKIYRITIFSKDLVSGTYTDGVYFVNLPDSIHEPNKYHLAVESLVVQPSSTTANVTQFMVEFLDINQPDTYNTSTQTNSRIALMTSLDGNILWNGTAAVTRNWCNFNRTITSDTIGIPLMDLNIMRSKQLRIQLKGLNDAVLATSTMGSSSSWVMTLVIYPFSP